MSVPMRFGEIPLTLPHAVRIEVTTLAASMEFPPPPQRPDPQAMPTMLGVLDRMARLIKAAELAEAIEAEEPFTLRNDE